MIKKLLQKLIKNGHSGNGLPAALIPGKSPRQKAFTFAGEDWYELKNPLDYGYERFMVMQQCTESLEYNMSRETLKAMLARFIELYESGKQAHALFIIKEIHDRLEWICEPDTMYKLASVVYLREDEDELTYNESLCQSKVARWKEGGNTSLSFFTAAPMKKFLPYLNLSDQDLLSYLQTAEKKAKAWKMFISELRQSKETKENTSS